MKEKGICSKCGKKTVIFYYNMCQKCYRKSTGKKTYILKKGIKIEDIKNKNQKLIVKLAISNIPIETIFNCFDEMSKRNVYYILNKYCELCRNT